MSNVNHSAPGSALASVAGPTYGGAGGSGARKSVGSEKLFKMKFMQRTVHAEQVKQAHGDQARLEREAKWRITRIAQQPKVIVTHSDSFLDFVPPPTATTGRHQFSASNAPPIVIGMDDADAPTPSAAAADDFAQTASHVSQGFNARGPMSKLDVQRTKVLSATASRLLAGAASETAAGSKKRKGTGEDGATEESKGAEPPAKRSRGRK